MESEISLKQKGGNYGVVVEIQPPAGSDAETSEGIAGFPENGGVGFSNVEMMNLITSNPIKIPNQTPTSPTPIPTPYGKPPIGPEVRRRTSDKTAYHSKAKSRVVEQNDALSRSPLTTSPNNMHSPFPKLLRRIPLQNLQLRSRPGSSQ
ncbi:hypothetical protein OROGR_029815 [Orobanche gracilis]